MRVRLELEASLVRGCARLVMAAALLLNANALFAQTSVPASSPDPPTAEAPATSRGADPPKTEATATSRGANPPATDVPRTWLGADPPKTEAPATPRGADPPATDAPRTSRGADPPTAEAPATWDLTDEPPPLEWPLRIRPSADRALVYTTPQDPDVLRAFGFQLAILLVGTAQYYYYKDVNSVDWEYDYEWSALQAKLDGSAYSFDSNFFDTNALAHSGAGSLYYLGARSSRLGPMSSLGVAFASSTLWEVLGEFRERISLNDMILTPFGGAAWGEGLFQLSTFFDRSCPTVLNRVLGSVLGPFKLYSDLRDDATPLRSRRCDNYGFTRVGEHRFDLSVGPRLVVAGRDSNADPYFVTEARVNTDIVNLSRYGKPGHGWRSFSDGNVSSFEAVVAGGPMGVEDFRLSTHTTFAGLHYRYLDVDANITRGRELLLGIGLGAEYSRHTFGGRGQRFDPAILVDLPSLMARWRLFLPSSVLEVDVTAATAYAAIGAFALPEYELRYGRADLTTAARNHGYNHALGVTLSPRIVWTSDTSELGIEARNDRLFGVRILDDETNPYSELPVAESRRRARLWLTLGERRGAYGRLDVAAYDRQGRIDDVSRRITELRYGAALGGRF